MTQTSERSFETVEDRAAPALTVTDQQAVSVGEGSSGFAGTIPDHGTDDFSVAHVPEVGVVIVSVPCPDYSWWSL
ncbi:hypothetical protein [Rhizobium jaguaris]|uniref:Uncharacterized protein n=1 Tax=Rhizobium jaguaris TaxID=1312183 RepID=A0A387G285_9HYPH|nr:hypothetical protein [Rhizobium jaguaris]AYG63917.1 hypothetical protein CCGE525_34310 [Rhizobium jaguaris]